MKRSNTKPEILESVGCLVKVGIPSFKRHKIGPKTIDSIFIGYNYQSIAHSFLLKGASNSYAGGTIVESMDAEFFVNIFPLKSSCCSNGIPSSNIAPSCLMFLL